MVVCESDVSIEKIYRKIFFFFKIYSLRKRKNYENMSGRKIFVRIVYGFLCFY